MYLSLSLPFSKLQVPLRYTDTGSSREREKKKNSSVDWPPSSYPRNTCHLSRKSWREREREKTETAEVTARPVRFHTGGPRLTLLGPHQNEFYAYVCREYSTRRNRLCLALQEREKKKGEVNIHNRRRGGREGKNRNCLRTWGKWVVVMRQRCSDRAEGASVLHSFLSTLASQNWFQPIWSPSGKRPTPRTSIYFFSFDRHQSPPWVTTVYFPLMAGNSDLQLLGEARVKSSKWGQPQKLSRSGLSRCLTRIRNPRG